MMKLMWIDHQLNAYLEYLNSLPVEREGLEHDRNENGSILITILRPRSQICRFCTSKYTNQVDNTAF